MRRAPRAIAREHCRPGPITAVTPVRVARTSGQASFDGAKGDLVQVLRLSALSTEPAVVGDIHDQTASLLDECPGSLGVDGLEADQHTQSRTGPADDAGLAPRRIGDHAAIIWGRVDAATEDRALR